MCRVQAVDRPTIRLIFVLTENRINRTGLFSDEDKLTMAKWYYYTKLVAGILSTIGASIMVFTAGQSLRKKVRSASNILFSLALSDLIFSFTGVISSILLIAYGRDALNSWRWHGVLFAAPHWSFEIASFLWTGALASYIIRQNRKEFSLNMAHSIIWMATIIYWILEVFEIETEDDKLNYAVRIVWDTVAILTLFNVILALMMFSRRRNMKSVTRGNSVVISRLILYMIAFITLVTPNIIKDMMYFGDIEEPLFGGIASTMFALLPLANSLIYVWNANCFSWSRSAKASYVSSATADTSTLGTVELKGLEIGEKIGQGLAVVYKGRWRGVEVAVKMQRLSLDNNDDLFGFQDACNAEIQQEAQLMKSLSHPNIVLFMEAGFYNGSICIISEFCQRGSLRDVLESSDSQELFWPMKIRLAVGIAQGLQYLHNAVPPMIHRDLKSPNIVVDETWHAKIADFGTLKFAEIIYSKDSALRQSGSEMTGLVGTTRWMAPEVIRGEKMYDEKIDIYSLGMILWELVEGRLPFSDIRWNHTIEKVILQGKRPVIPRQSCPPRWKVLITMCWQEDPLQRPTIQQVLRSLQRLAREEIWENMSEKNCTRLQKNVQSMDCDYILQYTACEVDMMKAPVVVTPNSDSTSIDYDIL